MRKLFVFIFILSILLIVLNACRDPDLEGAFVDYNAHRYDNALKLAQSSTQKFPNNPEAWKLLGEIYGKKDMIKDMVYAFDRSLTISKQYESEIKSLRQYYFQTTFNNGATNYNAFTQTDDRSSEAAKKSLNIAINDFKNAILIQKDYRAANLIGLCYSFLGESDSSLVYYTELTNIKPDTVDAWIALGSFYFADKQYDRAVLNLKKGLEIDPNNVDAITLISQSYDLLNDRPNAIISYQKAKEMNKEEKAFPFNLGLLYIKMATEEGIAEETKIDYLQKSVSNFAEVITLDAEMKEPYELKSTGEIQLGKYEDALITIKAALEHHPEVGSLWFNLGIVQSHLGNKTEAENAFKKAEELGFK